MVTERPWGILGGSAIYSNGKQWERLKICFVVDILRQN